MLIPSLTRVVSADFLKKWSLGPVAFMLGNNATANEIKSNLRVNMNSVNEISVSMHMT